MQIQLQTFSYQDNNLPLDPKGNLREGGCWVQVDIYSPKSRIGPDSRSIQGYALIDTGANVSQISYEAIDALGIEVIENEAGSFLSAGGKQKATMTTIKVHVPELDVRVPALKARLMGSEEVNHWKSVYHPLCIGLIGRELLEYCNLFYYGTVGKVILEKA